MTIIVARSYRTQALNFVVNFRTDKRLDDIMSMRLYNIQLMRYYEEVLAQSARNYAFTKDKKWEQRYRILKPKSALLLKNAIKIADKKEDKEFFVSMEKAHFDLVELETKSLELVNNDQTSLAVKLLESGEYERRRKILRDGLTEQVDTAESNELDKTSQSTNIVSDSVKTIINLERELYEKLRKADVIKEEFLAMVTHELKTPLVPIIGYVDILLSQKLGKINDAQKKRLEIIKTSTRFLLKMISDLLDAQKIELGQLTLVKNPHNLSQIIKDVLARMQPDLEHNNTMITTDLQENISCLCDNTRIEQVLVNLISNAMDFCPKNNGKINIKLQLDDNTHARISIIDNGIGIEKSKLDKIFVKFYQIDTSATREHGGTGLGLSVCKGIIENHGGKIWAESEVNDGTQIHILLPILAH
ncbi:MAG TPA: HAMP domain-containing sensor histidine kinase [Nitrosopumilaceae archaeon]|nr:HAMP domain-containing sensor histidine kinase [Nitrosopumilaceae archaeon]